MLDGLGLGELDGLELGEELGLELGDELGLELGPDVGPEVGPDVGPEVGLELGADATPGVEFDPPAQAATAAASTILPAMSRGKRCTRTFMRNSFLSKAGMGLLPYSTGSALQSGNRFRWCTSARCVTDL